MLLEASGLKKEFHGFVAVDDVSLSVSENEIRAVIGPNGAGKTTLFNLLMGIYEPTAGRIEFDGQDITDEPVHRRPELGISRSYQITNIYQSMSVYDNIETAVALHWGNYFDMVRPLRGKAEVAERTEKIIRRLDFEENSDVEASALSHGDKRLLEIGMAIASDPKLLLLDEPTAGTDSSETEAMLAFIEKLSEEMAVVLVEHNIEGVMQTADRISVLERGNVIAEGTPGEIRADKKVQEAYLGGEVDA